jgi:hypothetical protein
MQLAAQAAAEMKLHAVGGDEPTMRTASRAETNANIPSTELRPSAHKMMLRPHEQDALPLVRHVISSFVKQGCYFASLFRDAWCVVDAAQLGDHLIGTCCIVCMRMRERERERERDRGREGVGGMEWEGWSDRARERKREREREKERKREKNKPNSVQAHVMLRCLFPHSPVL